MKMQQPKQAIGRLIGSDVLKFIIGHKILLIFEFLHAPCKFRLFNSSSSPELSWVNTVSENVLLDRQRRFSMNYSKKNKKENSF
jgi:hypothetical protein